MSGFLGVATGTSDPTLSGDITGLASNNTAVSLTGTTGIITGPSTALTLGSGSKSSSGLLRIPYGSSDTPIIARRNSGDGGNENILTHAAATTRMWSGTVYGEVEAASGKLSLYAAGGLVHFASLANTRLMLGVTYASTGRISIPNSGGVATPLIAARNAGDTGDMTIASYNTTTSWAYWGDTTTVSANAGVYGNSVQLGCAVAGTHKVYVGATEVASIGKASGDHIDLGAAPASAGIIRISNNTAIKARNAAGGADLPLINSTSGDNIEIGTTTGTPASVVGNITVGCAGYVALRGGATIYNQINGNDVFTIGAGYVAIGATTASDGQLRLQTAQYTKVRNSTNNGDLAVHYAANAGGEYQVFGDVAAITQISGASLQFNRSGAQLGTWDATNGLTIANTGGPYLRIGDTAVASAGDIRGIKGFTIKARNHNNTSDTTLLLHNATDSSVEIGSTENPYMILWSSGSLYMRPNGGNAMVLSSANMTLYPTATIWSAGGNAPACKSDLATVRTTDATVTTLDSFTLDGYAITTWTATVQAKQEATENAGVWFLSMSYLIDASGTPVAVGTINATSKGTNTGAVPTGWDATIDNSGTTARIRVTGAAATNIRWSVVDQRVIKNDS